MEAGILKWRERAKQVTMTFDELELIRQQAIKEDEEKRRLERIQLLMDKVPLRFQNKSFGDYQVTCQEQGRAKKIAQRFVKTFSDRQRDGSCIQLLGGPGTGKSLLSLIIYQELARAGYSVQYEPSTQFLKILQEKRFESSAAFEKLMEHYRKIDCLILDEVTEALTRDGAPSEYERNLLFSLIDARYQEKRCTLVISNRNKHELITRLGKPLTDRLSENGIMLIFNWQSYRQ